MRAGAIFVGQKTTPLPQHLRFLILLLVPFLCTCDRGSTELAERAPETLFRVRTETGVESVNQLRETEEFNIVEYLYYYNGGGVAATDINGDLINTTSTRAISAFATLPKRAGSQVQGSGPRASVWWTSTVTA